eukprot:TRINITY_DN47645_c0_g1_i1.p1 TRINITY_DN47645_c0_g1~~TRINITY_DN47645_c0_g1_i1.p1  ORF type:complete len:621 (+),score=169.56 TRINITY_DN47645_c0_g1_i1:131-1993(+)
MRRQRQPKAAGLPGPPPVNVELRTATGQVLELEVPGRATAWEVKRQVSEKLPGAPPLCQRLVLGAEAIDDGAPLAAVLQENGGEVLRLMLVVSIEEAQKRLADDSVRVRKEALGAFAEVAPRGSKGAFAAVSGMLADSSPEVRLTALHALTKVANPGEEKALALASASLKDSNAGVRCAAIQAYTEMAPARCAQAIAAVSCMLVDSQTAVIQEALRALASLAPEGGRQVLDGAVEHLRHKRPEVRIAAMRAIAKGATAAVAAVAGRASVQAVTDAATLRDRSVDLLGPLLEDRDAYVRQEAVWAVSQLVPHDAERAVVAAAARLRHAGRQEARLGALKQLVKEAPIGSHHAMRALEDVLIERKLGLRLEGLKAMSQLAIRGNSHAISGVGACLGDHRGEVRLLALRLLPSLVPPQDARARAAAEALLSDEQEGVRREAEKVLGRLQQFDSPRSGQRCIEASTAQDASYKAGAVIVGVASRPTSSSCRFNVWNEKTLAAAMQAPRGAGGPRPMPRSQSSSALPCALQRAEALPRGEEGRAEARTPSAASSAAAGGGVHLTNQPSLPASVAAANLVAATFSKQAPSLAARNPIFAAAGLLMAGNELQGAGRLPVSRSYAGLL